MSATDREVADALIAAADAMTASRRDFGTMPGLLLRRADQTLLAAPVKSPGEVCREAWYGAKDHPSRTPWESVSPARRWDWEAAARAVQALPKRPRVLLTQAEPCPEIDSTWEDADGGHLTVVEPGRFVWEDDPYWPGARALLWPSPGAVYPLTEVLP